MGRSAIEDSVSRDGAKRKAPHRSNSLAVAGWMGDVSVERVEPAFLLPEREMVRAWLDYHRATLAWKCDGLSDDQLREAAVPPSALTLLGLVRHMGEVERWWFGVVFDRQADVERYPDFSEWRDLDQA